MVLCSPFEAGALTNLTTITERMYYVDFKVIVKGNRTVNSSTIKILKAIENAAHYFNLEKNMFVQDAVENAIKLFEDEIKQNKCEIKFDINYYTRKPNSKEVITKFIKESKQSKSYEKVTEKDIADYLTTNTFYNNKDDLNNSFETLTYQLLRYMPNPVADLLRNDVKTDIINEKYGKEYPFSILKFYCYFNYGLDKIHSSSHDTLLRDILEGNKFDYSQLDLSIFDDPNMNSDITINNYNAEYQGIINEYNKRDAAYKKSLGDYNNYITKVGTPNPAVEAKQLSIIQTQKDIFDKIKDLKDKADNFDLNKYTKNLNIINHLRNSIAHGNYEIDNSDINNISFIFNDIYNGVNTYSLKIKCDDFDKLFTSRNLIHNYLDKLSKEHLGKSMDRIHKEELLLDSTYVKENYMSSWNNLVTSVLDDNDEKQIRNIILTYLCMKEICNPSIYIKNKDIYNLAENLTIVRIFSSSIKVLEESQTVRMNGYDVSPSEYEEIIRNIITYSKIMDKYDYYINDELLPNSEKESILYNIYNNRRKTR